VTALLLSAALALVVSPPAPDQALVFYNARLALAEGRPQEVLKLWLLRNSLADLGQPGGKDPDFRSVVWAALGKLGYCPDGFGKDGGGAGLWPLALHNYLAVRLARAVPPEPQASFDGFESGRQERGVSLDDVLSLAELRSARFSPSETCLFPLVTQLQMTGRFEFDGRDRPQVGAFMQRLLRLSLDTLVRTKVETVAAVEARIFDLELALAHLASGGGRRPAALTEKQSAFLRRSLTWQASEWLTLGRERRLALFAQARPLAGDRPALDQLVLAIIDALIERGAGDEVEAWIGFFDAGATPERRRALTLTARGRRLLDLAPASGFHQRAAIALHRGVAFLEAGQLQEALGSFGYALTNAEAGGEPATVLALARRWLSYLLSRYQTDTEVIAALESVVPRQEHEPILEDLAWRAAFRGDARSFDRATTGARTGSAFAARVGRLRPLAHGQAGDLIGDLRASLTKEPHLTLRFVRQLLERLESEDQEVRAANLPMIERLLPLLESGPAPEGRPNAQARLAAELADRTRGLMEGLRRMDPSPAGRARALSSRRETFAGNIRLAPTDPLPWPFPVPEPQAPSAFAPLLLQPVEWRDRGGALVFGWRLTE
jgi:hypothetical protein